MSDIEKLRNGLSAYKHEQAVLLRLIKKHGKLSEHEFDRIFYANDSFSRTIRQPDGTLKRVPKRTKLSNRAGIRGDSFLLGGMSMPCSRDWYLDLLQHMMALDEIDTHREDGVLFYSLTNCLGVS